MPAAKEILAGGIAAPAADAITGSQALAVSAAGSTQATATVLSATDTQITTAAASTGVILPLWAQPGDEFWVYNGGANAVLVYPPLASGASIGAGAANAGFSVAANKGALFKMMGPLFWMPILSA